PTRGGDLPPPVGVLGVQPVEGVDRLAPVLVVGAGRGDEAARRQFQIVPLLVLPLALAGQGQPLLHRQLQLVGQVDDRHDRVPHRPHAGGRATTARTTSFYHLSSRPCVVKAVA